MSRRQSYNQISESRSQLLIIMPWILLALRSFRPSLQTGHKSPIDILNSVLAQSSPHLGNGSQIN